ncbi:MAG: tetratricopeptide repeat protein [Oligoflexia bacterium]|nr:tetratricopeptide repeat protein [Oligoflexia bacterium]
MRIVFVGLGLGILALNTSLYATSNSFVRFQSFKTHGRIIFQVGPDVPVEWQATPTGFMAFFKGSTLVDLGAPFGDEKRWASELSRGDGSRVASLRFQEVAGGVRVEGNWKFEKGPNAPFQPKMETFSYRENDPARFVADFWLKAGPTVAEVQAKSVTEAKKLAELRARQEVERRAQRRIASQKAKEELDDLTHFCREPLRDSTKDGRDIFLPYLPVHEKVDFAKYLPAKWADENFTYFRPEAPEGDGGAQARASDGQYVRLALDLYKDGKYALVIRTLDFLAAEYPKSEYLKEMEFLRANALLKLDLKADGERLLEQVRLDSRGLPPALHAALYLAAKGLEKNSPLETEEAFSWLIQNYPGHPLSWLFHLAVAESLYDIEQTDRATQEYKWVSEKAPESAAKFRAIAAFRVGDLYLKRGQYEQALSAYVRAIHQFPKQAADNPALLLNRAEALLGLHRYEEARSAYANYWKEFTSYPEGWRATLRLGEISAREEGSGEQLKARTWYYETINRFPFSPGSTIARIRLLPCGDHGGFTAEAADRFFSGEAAKFDSSDSASRAFVLSKYPDLRIQSRIRALIAFGRDEQALEAITEERARVQSPALQKELKISEGVLFRRMVLARLHTQRAEDQYAALKFYESRHASVEDSLGVDPDYLLELSHAAANLGLGKLAEQFARKYRETSSGGRSVAEAAPLDLDERLKVSDESFAEAKALWIHEQDDPKHYDEIRKKLDQVVSESRYALEKEVILGLLEQKLKKPMTALGHASKAELLAAGSSPDVLLRIRGWLASIEVETGDLPVALGMYRRLEAGTRESETGKKLTLLGVPALPTLEQNLLAQGMILDRKSRWGESAAVYAKAVDTGLGGNQAMYGLARALIHEGGKKNHEKAVALLEKISGSKTEDFWKDLAAKTLEIERSGQAAKNLEN